MMIRERILADVVRFYRHALQTDPENFFIAEDVDADKIVGFATATSRPPMFFVGFVFVLPDYAHPKAKGVGRTLFGRLMKNVPEGDTVGLTVDTAQPISNSLYAQWGVVGKQPLQYLDGPLDVSKIDFRRTLTPVSIVASNPTESQITFEDALPKIRALDADIVRFARRKEDWDFIYAGRPIAQLYKDEGGAVVGYSFARRGAGIGPVVVKKPELLNEVVIDALMRALEAGREGRENPEQVTVSLWFPSGALPELFALLLKAGMKISGFPMLLAYNGAAGEPFLCDLSRALMYSASMF
ncbi:hypothetical protein DFJ74DRAFT_655116 [Hyaloraphidium curvatum]|nr:hypothetical protein DFJ74DRAFT_655116 [Hyaloraphidium curvatum]